MSAQENTGERRASTALALAEDQPGGKKGDLLPLHNGVMSPDKWTMFGRMAMAVYETDFVPKGLRGNPGAVMACLMYGDSLGLHPSVALTDVYVADGKVGISGALMLAKVREAGHKIKFEWIRDDQAEIIGCTAKGWRIGKDGEVEDEDEWTYTIEDAKRAGLIKDGLDRRAAWFKTPHVMCRWRALAQLVRFLWPDLFRGGSVYIPDEAEEAAYAEKQKLVNGAPVENAAQQDDGVGVEYGDDPLLAAWLVALFAAANEIEPGSWLPKKIKLSLQGKPQDYRVNLAESLARWIEERGGIVPERPTDDEDEPVMEGEYEGEVADEGAPADDPGEHLNGDEDVAEVVNLD